MKLGYHSSALSVLNYIIIVIIKALDSIFAINSHTNMQHFWIGLDKHYAITQQISRFGGLPFFSIASLH